MKYKFSLILAVLSFSSIAQFKDSTNKVFVKKMITPVVLSVSSLAFLNQNIKDNQIEIYNTNFSNFSSKIDDYSTYAPSIAYFGLSLVNPEKRNERLIKGAMSMTMTNGTSWILKRIFKKERPDKSETLSFPSGHTTNAFCGATLLNKEFGGKNQPIVGVLGYFVATSTGMLRMANNKHWLSDVVAGAAIGIGGTEVSYFIYDKINKKIKNKKNNQTIIPFYDGQNFGLTSSISF